MSILVCVLSLIVDAFALGISIRHLQHHTRNMELFEEGCQVLRAEVIYLSEEQREELVHHVYSLIHSRRYAVMSTVAITVLLIWGLNIIHYLFMAVS